MDALITSFDLSIATDGTAQLVLNGDWTLQQECPDFTGLASQLQAGDIQTLTCNTDQLGDWDSALPAFLLQCHNYCRRQEIAFDIDALPEGTRKLLAVATAVAVHERPPETSKSLAQAMDPRPALAGVAADLAESLRFLGEIMVAFLRLLGGRANTRRVDFVNFIYQAGPAAFGIITLTSFLVGMILAYLGAAQLAQFGAQIYVADLVTVGMLREMGALMTAVVLAGRTGAAYAAQLGTMQTNEEIDAIVTLGISPVEFLVLPRMIALVVIMPLLVLYADFMGIMGGALVAMGMDVSPIQFLQQMKGVLSFTHVGVGLLKGTVFALLITIAGCRAGMQCGRSSAAVGEAATNAVVVSIVYLIIADAAFNILFQKMGI
jgi:phospholipid/cholesterol/gamma-HCH transport system permease protein